MLVYSNHQGEEEDGRLFVAGLCGKALHYEWTNRDSNPHGHGIFRDLMGAMGSGIGKDKGL